MATRSRRGALVVALIGTLAVLTGCERGVTAPAAAPSAGPSFAATSPVPARGTATTLDFATWNLEWFGDTSEGPGDESLQLENIRDIIAGLDMDLWSVQEVTGEAHFADLVSRLAGYDGFLANDPLVVDGAAYYSDFDNNELKVGLIYKTSMVTIHGARVILTDHDYDFAGRPPVEVTLTATVDGTALDLVVILLHAKAGSREGDWTRRSAGSAALKSYLDANHPTTRVMVIGDFNDDVDQSITRPKDSPYRNFVDDVAAYVFPTKTLSDAGQTSTVYYSEMIDHHLATNELSASYVAGSVEVFPADQYLASYDQTTSDHYPVLSRYSATSGGGSGGGDPVGGFVLAGTGYKKQGAWAADLSWSGATSATIDVYRNGASIATTENDGAYTDVTSFKGGGTLTYVVCEAGTSICSNEVTLTY